MSLSDIPFFLAQCEESARDGFLSQTVLNKRFEEQLRQIILQNENNQHCGHNIIILSRKSDDSRVGILWLCVEKDLAGRECIEIRLINIIKSMRGQGYGSLLLSVVLNDCKSHILTAKCLAKSFQMSKMLKQNGFDVIGGSKSGGEFLCLESPVRT